MSTIDISDLNLPELIQDLWSSMKPAAFFNQSGIRPPQQPSKEEISRVLAHDKYIDYLNGRCIKTNFSDLTTVDTYLYNRDAGNNMFENIVNKRRDQKKS
jgi:hypothetical protein